MCNYSIQHMQEKSNLSYFDMAKNYTYLKLQLNSFIDRQNEGFRSIVIQTDHFMLKQKNKNNFQADDYVRQLNLLVSQFEIYFTNIVVHLTSFPVLNSLSKNLEKIMNHYNKLLAFSQEYWLGKFRKLNREVPQTYHPPSAPSMELCLSCSENIRHQEIKKARYRMYNPIEDPFMMYHNKDQYTPLFSEESKQKELQDKLSELATNLQLGQSCMKEMIQQLNAEGKFANEEHNTEKEAENLNLPVMPLLKSMFNKMKTQKKNKKEAEVQTDNDRQQADQNYLDKNVCVKANIKMAAQITDKTQQIKLMEEKLSQSEKTVHDLMNQVTVLRQTNHNLQKRNSVLEVELNISIAHSKLTNNNKVRERKGANKRVEESPGKVQKQIDKAKEVKETKQNKDAVIDAIDEPVIQKARKSLKAEGRNKKSETSLGLPIFNKNILNTLNQTQPNIKFKSNALVQEDSLLLLQDQNNVPEQLEEPKIQVLSPIPDPINLQSELTSPRSSQVVADSSTLFKVSSSKQKLDMFTSENPSPQRKRKIRRLGTIYKRDQILKILFDEQIKNKGTSVDFQSFKTVMNSVISQALKGGKQIQSKHQKELSLYTAKTAQEKTRFRHIPKKSAAQIKQIIRKEKSQKKQELKDLKSAEKEPRKAHLLSIQETICFEDKQVLDELKQNLFENGLFPSLQNLSDKKVVLSNKQIHLMTELMAYLIQLKVTNKAKYYLIKRTIFNQVTVPEGVSEKEELQMSLSHIFSLHRGCSKAEGEEYCQHMKELMNCTIKFLS